MVSNANIRHCNDEKTKKLSFWHKYNNYYLLVVDGFIENIFARAQQMEFTDIFFGKKSTPTGVFVFGSSPLSSLVNSRCWSS